MDYRVVIDSIHSMAIKQFIDSVGSEDKRLYIYLAKVIELVEMGFPVQKAIERTIKLYSLC
jgi:hypothetical protein